MYTFEDLKKIMETLRSENGCPWDREQTHESLKKYFVEECAEVLEAIDNKDTENLCEELGDVLYQIMIHTEIEKEKGNFTIEDVVDGICRKMVGRHPAVFGGEPVEGNQVDMGNVTVSVGTISGSQAADVATLAWTDEDTGLHFRLHGTVDQETLVRIAESVGEK